MWRALTTSCNPRAAGVRRLVFPSSREVYGDPRSIPVPETAPLRAKNAYGASKIAGEVYCRLAALEGIETVVLRLANVYGSGDRDRVIPLFAAAARAGLPITVFGKQKILDFVWIDVVVDALIRAAFGSYIRGPVNIGSGKQPRLSIWRAGWSVSADPFPRSKWWRSGNRK